MVTGQYKTLYDRLISTIDQKRIFHDPLYTLAFGADASFYRLLVNRCLCSKLIQTGISFLGKLTQTLSSPEATQKLVSSIVQRDEKDGKTYLKIRVENEKIIENALALLAEIFNPKKN